MNFTAFILKNLIRRPVRTGLTVLGLAVAVGAMIALLGISDNFRRSVVAAFERRRIDLVVVPGGQTDQLVGKIDESVVAEVRSWPDVEAVSEAVIDLTEMWKRDRTSEEEANGENPPSSQVFIMGWMPDNFGYDDMEVRAGRKLTAEDTGQGRVMLGYILADNLDKKVGDTVTILEKRYEVVGVFKTGTVFEDGAIVIPMRDYQRELGIENKVTGFSVRVRKGADPNAAVEAVRQRIMALPPTPLKEPEKPNSSPDARQQPARKLSAEPPGKYADQASYLRITRAMAWVVSVIAIVIGIISMLNTMILSVLERTHEIGILRAVGWTRGRVVRMVLGEALFLGLAAALLGVVGAVGMTYVLTQMPKVNGFIEAGLPLDAILQGIGITVLIGLAGGAYPAYRASRMLPTEALRHD